MVQQNQFIRLQKMLSDCGVASRRKAEQLILEGHVKVNGQKAQIGDKVNPYKDKVFVSGKRITPGARGKNIYIMLHKPRGYITTMSDEMDRKCVAELVKDIDARIYPVGRLDRESEGLLIMTNDGDFANTLTHPKTHINKVYRVTIRPGITEDQVTALMTGMMIDGYKTAPCEVRVISKQEGRTVLEIVLREGRNRQIRKMCEQLGLEVARLKRISIGSVKMGMLQPGKWRDLTPDEIKKISTNPNPPKSKSN
ncbi:MAG: pseudouridine synthase [Bacillota bacterium]|nr:pseudouridine synthase [Bacillota bacterium]